MYNALLGGTAYSDNVTANYDYRACTIIALQTDSTPRTLSLVHNSDQVHSRYLSEGLVAGDAFE